MRARHLLLALLLAAAEPAGGLTLPPFRSHDHRWEWTDSADLGSPLVVLLVKPLENDRVSGVAGDLQALTDLSHAGVSSLVVTHQGNFGANREFASRHGIQTPVVFSLPDPALAGWVEDWKDEMPTAFLFFGAGPATAWGDAAGIVMVLVDLREGQDPNDPAYDALLDTLHDPQAPIPPGSDSALAAWAEWRGYRLSNQRALGLQTGLRPADAGAFEVDPLMEEGRLLMGWAPRGGDAVLEARVADWQGRLLQAIHPEGDPPGDWLEPLLGDLEAIGERLDPAARGWFALMLDRPAQAAVHFGALAAEEGASWVHAVHLLTALASDPDATGTEVSVPASLLDVFGTPATDRQAAFSHLARDLLRMEQWWGERREMPPAFHFALGMTYSVLRQTQLADERLDPLRDDPVWGPVVEAALTQ